MGIRIVRSGDDDERVARLPDEVWAAHRARQRVRVDFIDGTRLMGRVVGFHGHFRRLDALLVLFETFDGVLVEFDESEVLAVLGVQRV